MLVVTTEGIPGYEVRAVIGEVVGVTARSFNPFVEGVKSLNGRLNPQLVQLLTQIRHDAVAEMVESAEEIGANAIIGMRYDHRGVTPSWNEVCAYGTAVLVAAIGGETEADEAADPEPSADPAGSDADADADTDATADPEPGRPGRIYRGGRYGEDAA